jgi:hypothetical protein
MAWPCCENGWRKDSEEVTGRQTTEKLYKCQLLNDQICKLANGEIRMSTPLQWGNAVAQWLSYCATNQKVAGSIQDDVMEFFIDINPSDRTMALASTQSLTEMSTRRISWG